eukprot:TRINITY_DN51166_c0_g2_i1.p1 TRINITY_DN51166_c0_g2~~TRINITY_DN51166_c0_g2_i1.p1  ORF type:complete len:325 (+),score=10.25 TRINITY_DN51166_c0_g2_i1:48-977(+)
MFTLICNIGMALTVYWCLIIELLHDIPHKALPKHIIKLKTKLLQDLHWNYPPLVLLACSFFLFQRSVTAALCLLVSVRLLVLYYCDLSQFYNGIPETKYLPMECCFSVVVTVMCCLLRDACSYIGGYSSASLTIGTLHEMFAIGNNLTGFWVVTFSLVTSLGTVLALVAWSWWVVNQQHGPVQKMLRPVLVPYKQYPWSWINLRIAAFAVANAIVEELEFRCILFAASVIVMPHAIGLVIASVMNGVMFATVHYGGGFPSGAVGWGMVLVWSLALTTLRQLSGGMLIVLVIHIIADATIGVLVAKVAKK